MMGPPIIFKVESQGPQNIQLGVKPCNTIRVSNCLDPDQARHFVMPDLGPNCLQRFQQTTKVAASGQRVRVEQLVDTTF